MKRDPLDFMRGYSPMQSLVDAIGRAGEEERSRSQMTLGGLVDALRVLPEGRLVAGLGELDSYRGYYSDLAFAPTETPCTVASLLRTSEWCMGRYFTGYKGGDFLMGERTPLWVSPYGSSSGMRLMGLDTDADLIAPITSEQDDS